MRRFTIDDVRRVALPSHGDASGQLVVIEEGKSIPYPVLRMFTVRAAAGAVRGRHAHRECTQFLVCVHGSIEVECDDGDRKATYLLDSGDVGLLIPGSVWATETYQTEGAVLSVSCDRHYEVADYIRDYPQFLAWRRSSDE